MRTEVPELQGFRGHTGRVQDKHLIWQLHKLHSKRLCTFALNLLECTCLLCFLNTFNVCLNYTLEIDQLGINSESLCAKL